MLSVNFTYSEAQTVLYALTETKRTYYNPNTQWKLVKTEGKMHKTMDKKDKGDKAEYHKKGQREEQRELRRLLKMVSK